MVPSIGLHCVDFCLVLLTIEIERQFQHNLAHVFWTLHE